MLLAVLAVTNAAHAVPSQFQGQWRVSLAECPPTITDQPVWINASHIRIDHSTGNIRVVAKRGRRDVTVAGELLSDGGPWDAKLGLELSEGERELKMSDGDWAVKLQRCPEEKTNK
jgi:hypothetical protein